jgi:hypothetical protein
MMAARLVSALLRSDHAVHDHAAHDYIGHDHVGYGYAAHDYIGHSIARGHAFRPSYRAFDALWVTGTRGLGASPSQLGHGSTRPLVVVGADGIGGDAADASLA